MEQSAFLRQHQTLLWECFWEPSTPDFSLILVHLIKTKHPTSRQIQSLLCLPDYNGVIYKNALAIRWGRTWALSARPPTLRHRFTLINDNHSTAALNRILKTWRPSSRLVLSFNNFFSSSSSPPSWGSEIALPASGRCLLNDSWHKQCVNLEEVIWT